MCCYIVALNCLYICIFVICFIRVCVCVCVQCVSVCAHLSCKNGKSCLASANYLVAFKNASIQSHEYVTEN